mmetsp:Transcript_53940/g.172957  ORF Transcript_53940/g.172957 Transcript_53940/m.172957 type:complete len:558 (-) Transcript_53940:470-2143(-)
MTRKTTSKGMGKAIMNEHQRRAQRMREQAFVSKPAAQEEPRSVLEQSSLDELLATVEVRKESWAAVTGEAEYVEEGPALVSTLPRAEAERAAAERRELVSIPRRPPWREGMPVEELASLEAAAFMEWRRGLALASQEEGLHLTPYERNLDFWRQLWRCLERSDLLVQIVDARDPDFYYCRDLGRYVEELGGEKRLLLLVNKADFLTVEQREGWREHFAAQGIDALFFSALRELLRQRPSAPAAPAPEPAAGGEGPAEPASASSSEAGDEPSEAGEDPAALAEAGEEVEEEEAEAPLGPLRDDDLGVADASRLLTELCARLPGEAGQAAGRARLGTVGFVGYPNVGKSTVINALLGAKKVATSRTPGKTKHIQTLELPELGVTLCDCPGLVFPSVAATRAHLVINNTVPLDDLRECFSPIALIIEKLGFARVLESYGCAGAVQDARARSGDHVLDDAHAFLAALAVARNHFLRLFVPDENWAARKVLRDYVAGRLLHCEPPPTAPAAAAAAAGPRASSRAATAPRSTRRSRRGRSRPRRRRRGAPSARSGPSGPSSRA